MTSRGLLVTVLLAACCATTLPAQGIGRDWRPEDRTFVGDYSRVLAVAAGSERVWIVTPDAVLGWDPRFRRWDGPYLPDAGVSLAGMTTALVDPLDQSLWLGGTDGWAHWQPDLRLWDGGRLGGAVRLLAADADDPAAGVYLRTAAGWFIVRRGAGIASPAPSGPRRPVTAVSVQEALRANPMFAAGGAAALLDERLRGARITSAAQAWDRRGWYFGTWGAGVLYVEEGMVNPEPLRYGLAGSRVGAIFAAPGGVWVATDRDTNDDAALTFVARELDEFRAVRGGAATGLPFTATRVIAGLDDALWLGTDAGVVRIDPDGRATPITEARGLPDSRVLALAAGRGRITVGTARGLARLDPDSLRAEPLAPGYVGEISSVAVLRDTIWAGTREGVRVLAPGGDALLVPSGLATGTFTRPVLDLAWAGDTLLALTRDELFVRDAAGVWTAGPAASAVLGDLGLMAVDRDGVWLVGDGAVGYARPGVPPLPVLRPEDIPGRVTSVAVDDDYLWLGTTRGLVRFRLDALRP